MSRITKNQKRIIYKIAFNKEYDNKNRKQAPLPLDIAYMVALNRLNKGGLNNDNKKNKHR